MVIHRVEHLNVFGYIMLQLKVNSQINTIHYLIKMSLITIKNDQISILLTFSVTHSVSIENSVF